MQAIRPSAPSAARASRKAAIAAASKRVPAVYWTGSRARIESPFSRSANSSFVSPERRSSAHISSSVDGFSRASATFNADDHSRMITPTATVSNSRRLTESRIQGRSGATSARNRRACMTGTRSRANSGFQRRSASPILATRPSHRSASARMVGDQGQCSKRCSTLSRASRVDPAAINLSARACVVVSISVVKRVRSSTASGEALGDGTSPTFSSSSSARASA